MNYNRFKELSRNKRGLVGGEEVRRRNSKPHRGRKRNKTDREMRNCREASGPLDVSEVPLSTTAGGAGKPLGDNINIYEVMKLTEYYLSDNETAKHKLVPE